jgi:peptide/nickel transport system permease protein
MLRYAVRRLALAVITLWLITTATFLVVHLAPGDPAHAAAQPEAVLRPATVERLRAQFHLDEPLPQRYGRWLKGAVQLDFGRSFHSGEPVRTRMAQRLPNTAFPAALAVGVALIVAIPLGAYWSTRRGWIGRVLGGLTLTAYAIPRYVMGMLVIVVVGVRLGWLPFVGSGDWDSSSGSMLGRGGQFLRHAALLIFCLAYPLAAFLTRFVGTNIRAALASDYARTARATGASLRRTVWLHALPNTLLPLLTTLGLLLPPLLGGTVILEVMFSWPGLGRLMFEAAVQRDYPLIMGLATFSAVLVLGATLVVDLLYAVADPRVRAAP